jgi:simple sugar transport system permease protein
MTAMQPDLRKKKKFERLTDAQLLTIISGGIFLLMYGAALLLIEEFQKPQVFFDITNYYSYLIIIACSLTVVMIGGGINISVGGVICLTCMVCSIFLNNSGIEDQTLLVLATFGIAIGIGAVFGAFQGALISYLEIQPFIITLGGMFLARGLTTILSGGENVPVSEKNPFTLWISNAAIKIPELGTSRIRKGQVFVNPATLHWVTIIAVAVVIAIYLVMRFTKFGRNTYAIGGNVMSDGFGMIAMVALLPPITVQVLGLIYHIKTRRTRVEYSEIDNTIIEIDAPFVIENDPLMMATEFPIYKDPENSTEYPDIIEFSLP